MGLLDKLTGRAKQAAGDLKGDRDLQSRGRLEERKGEAKDELSEANEDVRRKADRVADLERRTR